MAINVQFREESASAHLIMFNDHEAVLSSVKSENRRQGHARLLLQKIMEYADDNGIVITLTVNRYGHPIGPPNEVLKALYSEFGFVVIGGIEAKPIMQRTPVQQF